MKNFQENIKMEQNTIRGALDFSWGEAAFAMMRGDELLVRENRLFSGHDMKIVNIRVYCDNFLLPASPSSFCNCSR